MANYKLALDLGKKEYKEINWNKTKNIPIKEANKLKTLVEFTLDFKNEQDLKEYLLKNELITLYDWKKKICIIYNQNGTKKLMYGISYENSKKFFDETSLKDALMKKIPDLEFLEKLSNHYRNTFGQAKKTEEINLYIRSIQNNHDPYDRVNIISTLEDLFKDEVYPKKKKTKTLKINSNTGEVIKGDPNLLNHQSNLEKKHDRITGIITYTQIIKMREFDFKRFRDLAMFISHYENSKNKVQINQEIKQEIKKEEKNLFEEEWEQVSLFDNIPKEEPKKWVLSSEGEPEFPPNSEEEKWYNEYLENLPDEYEEDEETFKRR